MNTEIPVSLVKPRQYPPFCKKHLKAQDFEELADEEIEQLIAAEESTCHADKVEWVTWKLESINDNKILGYFNYNDTLIPIANVQDLGEEIWNVQG